MIIDTRDFGRVEVDAGSVFAFPEGLYGFEKDRTMALFVRTYDDIPFLYLQSVTNTVPCFLVFEPVDLFPGFAPEVDADDLKALEATSSSELMFLLIANVPDSVEGLSLNVKSPIAINPKTKIGRQIILQNDDYSLRYQPFSAEEGRDA